MIQPVLIIKASNFKWYCIQHDCDKLVYEHGKGGGEGAVSSCYKGVQFQMAMHTAPLEQTDPVFSLWLCKVMLKEIRRYSIRHVYGEYITYINSCKILIMILSNCCFQIAIYYIFIKYDTLPPIYTRAKKLFMYNFLKHWIGKLVNFNNVMKLGAQLVFIMFLKSGLTGLNQWEQTLHITNS